MKKLLVVALAFSSLYMSSCKSGGGDPKAVLNSFFDAMAKKDIAAVRKLTTSDSKTMVDAMEEGMKMEGNTMDDKSSDQFDKSKVEIGEARINGDNATVSVKEKKSGSAVDFVLKKEGGAWKVAMDMATMVNMSADKMKKEGMTDKQMNEMKKGMEKLKGLNIDSLKKALEKN